jgi:hypothetical protein
MSLRPETETRVLIATIALIVALSWINGCATLWEAETTPLAVTR